jgi:hypothetical protein
VGTRVVGLVILWIFLGAARPGWAAAAAMGAAWLGW